MKENTNNYLREVQSGDEKTKSAELDTGKEFSKEGDLKEVNVLPRIEHINGEINPEIINNQPQSGGSQQTDDNTDDQTDQQTVAAEDTATTVATTKTITKDDTPQIADDADLIEKEWVNKAKELVEKTKTDPRQQNIALSKMKANYLKKRFNKVIKTEKEG